jgi:hypothetical protein
VPECLSMFCGSAAKIQSRIAARTKDELPSFAVMKLAFMTACFPFNSQPPRCQQTARIPDLGFYEFIDANSRRFGERLNELPPTEPDDT